MRHTHCPQPYTNTPYSTPCSTPHSILYSRPCCSIELTCDIEMQTYRSKVFLMPRVRPGCCAVAVLVAGGWKNNCTLAICQLHVGSWLEKIATQEFEEKCKHDIKSICVNATHCEKKNWRRWGQRTNNSTSNEVSCKKLKKKKRRWGGKLKVFERLSSRWSL